MKIKFGDKLKCLKTIYNIFQMPLFIENDNYEVLGIDEDDITLNHILYGNEYCSYNINFILENFEKQ
jgi:hypothetical protein